MSLVKGQKSKVNGSTTGFTIIEVILSLAIVVIVAGVTVSSLSRVNQDKALTLEAQKVISLLVKARSETLSAKGDSAYGVHFEERKAVLFKGSSYSAGASTNEMQPLNDAVKISSVTLTGGGADVLFKKLTGTTAQSGSVTLSLVRMASSTKIITITGTGIAYSN